MAPSHHMSSQLTKPRAAVLAVTFRGDDVILVRRKNQPQQGGWGFPGGSIEAGESMHDATLRELFEETGVVAEVVKFLEVVEIREFDATGQHHHFILLAMLCRYVSGEPTPGDDASACCWVSIPTGLAQFDGPLIEHVASVALRAQNQFQSNQQI